MFNPINTTGTMIISPEDIRQIRPIAENLNDVKRLVPYINECEKLYLIPAIGPKQYLAIEKAIAESKADNPTPLPEEIKALLEGCFYNEDESYSEGLKMAMGYLVYSRFVRNQNVNVTAFAVVNKNSEFSEKVDDKTIVRIANDAEKIGLEYLNHSIAYFNFGKDESVQRSIKNRCKFKVIGD